MMKFKLTFLFAFFGIFCCVAAQVDTILVKSEVMGKEIKTVVISPEGASDNLPVLYLLHGYSGDYSNWINRAPIIKELVDFYGYMVVCPDGGFGSWYWDVEGDRNYQYETFVSKELVNYIDKHYRTNADRLKRGISGLSMGGHGAMYLAIRHQSIFSSVGTTSGGVDFRPFPNNWQIADRLGSYSDNPLKWDKHTVIENLYLIKPGALNIFIDCGTEDFFAAVNEKLHQKLTYLNIPHRYFTMPGAHNAEYWSKSIRYQMAFFDEMFNKN